MSLRFDPNAVAITRDRQRLGLADLVDRMESSPIPLMQVYAGRLRALLTLGEEELYVDAMGHVQDGIQPCACELADSDLEDRR